MRILLKLWLRAIPILLSVILISICSAEDAPLTILKQLTLTPKEISRMLKGEIVGKKLEIRDNRDIAVLGAMLLKVPAVATVESARDIKKFKEGKEILGLEKFQSFHVDEMKALTLDEQEVMDLGECRVQDCESKMPAAWIRTLSGERDKNKRMLLLRTLLTEYAEDYAARGNKAVLDYENKKHPVEAEKEFENLLEDSSYLKEISPEFHQYLKEYPQNVIPGTENFLYWSREKFGFKPVINLTHVSIYPWSQAGWNGYLIASRQVYADHYYDASLGLTILIDRPLRDGVSPGSYLIYINRSRIDMLDGFLSSLKRAVTLSRVRNGLETHMKSMRQRVEDKAEPRSTQRP